MILYTGASGFLGKIAFPILQKKFNVVGLCHTNSCNNIFTPVDITNQSEILNLLDKLNPETVIHSAACREPDLCEKNPNFAFKLNSDATNFIASWCAQNQKKLLYISTDYVFDGKNPPYNENDDLSPVNVYGKSKAIGESHVKKCPNHIIIRIPLQFGFSVSGENSIISKILSALNQNISCEVNNVQVRFPTLCDDVAYAISDLLKIDFNGTIHLSGHSPVTRYDIWKETADVFGLDDSKIIPTEKPVEQFAPRPYNSQLSTKLYDSLNLHKFHSFRDGLIIIKNKMKNVIG